MHLEHSFRVPVPPEQAWPVLLDVERIAPCMPGATLESTDGDSFTGSVKVKVGPITISYGGQARFVERDDDAHRVVIEAAGKEKRGAGTAKATVTTSLHPDGDGTRVDVDTELAITGKPAQFGRGVMVDVGAKLIGQFADCLADEIGASEPVPAAPEAAAPEPAAAAPAASRERPVAQPIDLFDAAGLPVAKRLAPVAAVALLLLLVVLIRRRRRV